MNDSTVRRLSSLVVSAVSAAYAYGCLTVTPVLRATAATLVWYRGGLVAVATVAVNRENEMFCRNGVQMRLPASVVLDHDIAVRV